MSALVALLKGRLEGLLTEEEFENAKKQLLVRRSCTAAFSSLARAARQFFWASKNWKGTPWGSLMPCQIGRLVFLAFWAGFEALFS